VKLARETGSPRLLTRALIWTYATSAGVFDWCYPESELREAAELAASTGDFWMLAHAHAGLGDLYCVNELFKKARTSYDEARRGFEKLGDRFLLAWTLEGIGRVEAGYGNRSATLEYTQRSLELFDQVGDELDVGLMMARIVRTVREDGVNSDIALIAGAASRMMIKRQGDDLSKTPTVIEAVRQLADLDRQFPSEWIRGMSLSRAEAVAMTRRYITCRRP
jgi:hypothetical protein